MRGQILGIIAALGIAVPAHASGEEFEVVTDQGTFLNVVTGKKLTRFGITLDVLPSGEIKGRAFGRNVTGAWRWENGYFCRDLYFGEQDLGPNCQAVKINGTVMRFISDRGQGQFADLRLKAAP